MHRALQFSWVPIVVVAGMFGCGGSRPSREELQSPDAAAGPTCSDLAKQYKEILASDASLCTIGDDSTCMARRPIWGVEMAGDAIVSYSLSECPQLGSGAPVNAGRVARLDEVLATYRKKGCSIDAGPGCGVPGWTPPTSSCAAGTDGIARCQ